MELLTKERQRDARQPAGQRSAVNLVAADEQQETDHLEADEPGVAVPEERQGGAVAQEFVLMVQPREWQKERHGRAASPLGRREEEQPARRARQALPWGPEKCEVRLPQAAGRPVLVRPELQPELPLREYGALEQPERMQKYVRQAAGQPEEEQEHWAVSEQT